MRLKRQKGAKLTGVKKWLDCDCGESELVDETTVRVRCGMCTIKDAAKVAPVDSLKKTR